MYIYNISVYIYICVYIIYVYILYVYIYIYYYIYNMYTYAYMTSLRRKKRLCQTKCHVDDVVTVCYLDSPTFLQNGVSL